VITADEVDTLLFDVLGTVVGEVGSMREELRAALDQVDAGQQTEALASARARRFAASVNSIRHGAPWRSAHEVNAEALTDVLHDGSRQLPEAAVRHLALAGHRLSPWPDLHDALRRSQRASPSWHRRTETSRC